MNRRNFLAFLPTISAIPLIGKDIIQKPDKIEIIQPEEFNTKVFDPSKVSEAFLHHNLQIAVFDRRTGQELGRGYCHNITIHAPLIDSTCKDYEGYSTFSSRYQEVNVSGQLNSFTV